MIDDVKFMQSAYKEALKAKAIDEVPIGAVIVKDGTIIARAYNQREKKQMVTAHAETMVIEKACKKLKTWRLEECTLYSTLEPCVMCSGVIMQSRIKRVVYGASSEKWVGLSEMVNTYKNLNSVPEIISAVLEEECSTLIKQYFRDKR